MSDLASKPSPSRVVRPPIISMVVSAYNQAEYLRDAVWSLLACDDDHCEIIVVDDGSTDNTADAMRRFQSDRRVLYVKQENRGQAGAFNTGVRAAQGQLIGLVDGDDFSFPHKVRTIRRLFDRHELWARRALLRHPLIRFTDTAGVDEQPSVPTYTTLQGRAHFGDAELTRLTTAEETQAHVERYGFWPLPAGVSSSTMMTRELADAVFPVPETMRYCGDLFPILGGCLLGEAYATLLPLGGYRIHGGNHSLTAGSHSVETWRTIERWLDELLARDGREVRVDFFRSPESLACLARNNRTSEALRSAVEVALHLRDERSMRFLLKSAILYAAQKFGLVEPLLRTGRF